MKDRITIDGEVYIKEKSIKREELELFSEIEYAGYKWNIIAKDEEGITLLMKDILPNSDIKEIFDKEDYDSDYDVRFSNKSDGLWWKDSIIRKSLNDKFLDKLNKNDLVEMKTETCLYGESHITNDYVRLLSIEEYFKIPKEILSKGSWYWSLSPYDYNVGARVFDVNGGLSGYAVRDGGGVAPVIKLKTDYCKHKVEAK